MKNNLRDTIEEIAEWNVAMERYTSSYPPTVADEMVDKLTEAILQAVRDVVPEKHKMPSWLSDEGFDGGYNQCRLDMLKELGGGE